MKAVESAIAPLKKSRSTRCSGFLGPHLTHFISTTFLRQFTQALYIKLFLNSMIKTLLMKIQLDDSQPIKLRLYTSLYPTSQVSIQQISLPQVSQVLMLLAILVKGSQSYLIMVLGLKRRFFLPLQLLVRPLKIVMGRLMSSFNTDSSEIYTQNCTKEIVALVKGSAISQSKLPPLFDLLLQYLQPFRTPNQLIIIPSSRLQMFYMRQQFSAGQTYSLTSTASYSMMAWRPSNYSQQQLQFILMG